MVGKNYVKWSTYEITLVESDRGMLSVNGKRAHAGVM